MIYIVRHGETDYNKEDRRQGWAMVPLNATGIRQAKDLGSRIAKLPITKIYSSDLTRAKQTAEIANAKLKLPIIIDSRLREFDCGESIRGLLRKDTPPDLRENAKKYGAENAQDVFIRLSGFIKELRQNKTDNVLIITHGGALGVMLLILNNPELTADDVPNHQIKSTWGNTEIIVVTL